MRPIFRFVSVEVRRRASVVSVRAARGSPVVAGARKDVRETLTRRVGDQNESCTRLVLLACLRKRHGASHSGALRCAELLI